jgi:hypothetical protein
MCQNVAVCINVHSYIEVHFSLNVPLRLAVIFGNIP